MKKLILVIVIILLSLNLKSQTPITYIEKYSSVALTLMNEHDIPASIIIGISMLESANGTSPLSKKKNNYFGIKSGQYYKSYEDDIESFNDFCMYISKKKYYNYLIKNDIDDYNIWLNEINKSGYAEDINWINKVKNNIKKYKLYELDNLCQYET